MKARLASFSANRGAEGCPPGLGKVSTAELGATPPTMHLGSDSHL